MEKEVIPERDITVGYNAPEGMLKDIKQNL